MIACCCLAEELERREDDEHDGSGHDPEGEGDDEFVPLPAIQSWEEPEGAIADSHQDEEDYHCDSRREASEHSRIPYVKVRGWN